MQKLITYEKLSDDFEQPLMKYTANNENGYSFSCLNYGATLTSITMPDKDGKTSNILLGFHHPTDFIHDQTYFFGKAIGRVGGRIHGGSFHIGDQHYEVPKNEGKNTLHGGENGFQHLWWNTSKIENGIIFTKTIDSALDGFPGTIKASITYQWEQHNQLLISFKAENQSNIPTLFNPTTHNYFNLNHDQSEGLRNHELSIHGEEVLELDEDLIPTGKLRHVAGTAFDFRHKQHLSDRLECVKQMNLAGYDHPYKVSGPQIAVLKNVKNGRVLTIESDRNGLVFYSLNAIDPNVLVNDGMELQPHMAVALEPQTLPGAIHHPDFGDIILPARAEQTYRVTYELSVESE